MNTTSDVSPINQFDLLPDELLEKIFFSLGHRLLLISNNHVLVEPNSYYFDYSTQKPILKQTHIELSQVSLVCRRFYRIIKAPRFWEQKCRQEHVLLPSQCLPIDFTAYEKLYVNNPFHPSFNLLEDNKWSRSRYADSQIEPVPVGSHRLYDEFNRLSPCRATSYTRARFFQRDIQLPCRGPGSTDFAHLCPVIEFSICVAARWDCGSRCAISLSFSNGHQWQTEKIFPQWTDQKWHRLIYRYGQYNQLPLSVTVCITGCDTQGWAGFYGSKVAQARLRLLLRTSVNGTNTETAMIIEPRADDELAQEGPEPSPFQDNLPVDKGDSG